MGKYEEALERARKGMPIDEVFPELKESEDERIRKELLEVIRHCYEDGGYTLCTDDYKKYSTYLEKQKDSPMPEDTVIFQKGVAEGRRLEREEQQPVEWSEEDERITAKLLSYFNEFDESTSFGSREVIEIRHWLKSLRPQPHWKPSEEQMKALKLAYEDAFDCPEGGVPHLPLQSLYQDLQKLL